MNIFLYAAASLALTVANTPAHAQSGCAAKPARLTLICEEGACMRLSQQKLCEALVTPKAVPATRVSQSVSTLSLDAQGRRELTRLISQLR